MEVKESRNPDIDNIQSNVTDRYPDWCNDVTFRVGLWYLAVRERQGGRGVRSVVGREGKEQMKGFMSGRCCSFLTRSPGTRLPLRSLFSVSTSSSCGFIIHLSSLSSHLPAPCFLLSPLSVYSAHVLWLVQLGASGLQLRFLWKTLSHRSHCKSICDNYSIQWFVLIQSFVAFNKYKVTHNIWCQAGLVLAWLWFDWPAPTLSRLSRASDWLLPAPPYKLSSAQLRSASKATEPQYSWATQDMTPFTVNEQHFCWRVILLF